MNKKKLPKAIMRTRDDIRAAAFASGTSEPPVEPPAELGKLRDASAVRRVSEHADNVVEMKPGPETPSAHSDGGSTLPTLPSVTIDAGRRRSTALAIVDRYTACSAIGGLIPLPLANFAGVTTVIVRMVKVLSDHYGVPFERDRARTIVVALVGGAMPTGVATLTMSALIYILPPSALVGLAASAITATTFTRGVGKIFIEHFESGATLEDFPARASMNGVFDPAAIQSR
jgi:uncharacterized protein (DUF697 family)